MLVLVYTCQNTTLLEITSRGSCQFVFSQLYVTTVNKLIPEPKLRGIKGNFSKDFLAIKNENLLERKISLKFAERSGSVVECLTQD